MAMNRSKAGAALFVCLGFFAGPEVYADPLPPPQPSTFLEWLDTTAATADQHRSALIDAQIVTCMAGKGFVYRPTPAPAIQVTTLFGSLDVAAAKQYGFTDPEPPERLEDVTKNGAPADPAGQAAWRATLDGEGGAGTPVTDPVNKQPFGELGTPGGCAREAIAAVHGSVEAGIAYDTARAVVDEFSRAAYADMLASAAFTETVAAWRACMDEHGAPPGGPFGSYGSARWPEPRPSALERSAAVADVECRIRVDAESVGRRAMGTYIEAHYESYRPSIELLASFTGTS